MPGAPEIRPAHEGDLSDVVRIWREGWADGHLGHVPDELVAVRTPQTYEERATARMSQTWVALVDDAVAGFVMVVGDELEQVYVDRSHRGSGVAAALLATGERVVAAGGHPAAWLAVATGNTRARRFYERHGWLDGGPFTYQASAGARTVPVPCHRYVRDVRERRDVAVRSTRNP